MASLFKYVLKDQRKGKTSKEETIVVITDTQIEETTDAMTEVRIEDTTYVMTEVPIEDTTDVMTEVPIEETILIKITITKIGSVKAAEILIFHSEQSVIDVMRQKILALIGE